MIIQLLDKYHQIINSDLLILKHKILDEAINIILDAGNLHDHNIPLLMLPYLMYFWVHLYWDYSPAY